MSITKKRLQRKEPWKDLVLPYEKKGPSRGRRHKTAKKYEKTLDAYRALASRFHKELLKKSGSS